MKNIIKDLIGLNIFIFSLLILYQTTNHLIALITVILLSLFYIVKHFKLNHFIKNELKGQIEVFQTLFNSSSDVIVYTDLNLKVIACNKALTKDFGMPVEQLIGESLKRIFEAKSPNPKRINKVWKKLHSHINKAIRLQAPIQLEDEYYSVNKELNAYNLIISPTFSSTKKVNGAIIVARNVSSERLAIKQALEKENQLKCILENMPLCAYMKDKHDHFIIGSSSFEEIIGENSDVRQLNISDLYDENYLKFIKNEEAQIYKTKKIIDSERQVILPNQTFWGRVRKVPVLDDNGDVKYLVVMYQNLESEKEIERQKEYFIETLIHDLKVPTIAQLRGLEVLKKGTLGALNCDEIELISQIENSCKYILDMIAIVLNTYRFENGQNKLYYEKFNISELLLKCFEELSEDTKEKNLTFAYAGAEAPIILEADKSEIKKVIIHLLLNSILYSNKNEKILITILEEANQLKFTITSKGIPLSERECCTLFDRASTHSPKYSTIGNGIGLYLCKKIIDVHKGNIYASTDGKCTNTITFTLPLIYNDLILKKTSPLFI